MPVSHVISSRKGGAMGAMRIAALGAVGLFAVACTTITEELPTRPNPTTGGANPAPLPVVVVPVPVPVPAPPAPTPTPTAPNPPNPNAPPPPKNDAAGTPPGLPAHTAP